MTLLPGQRVDRYVVESLLGAGGMAEVYAVRHATLGSAAALKVLRTRSPQLSGRMMREGRAQSRLRHPNVVAVLDLLDVDGAPALLMERVDGPTLAEVLANGALPLDRVERIARGLMAGLHAAHAVGVVHRDLKPANVLLAAGDVPRIADFGLATALADDTDPGLTRPGTPIGTPAYMAPEQHEDASDVDGRADLFALGVVLYEMVAGAAPAAGANLVVAWSKMSQRRWKPLDEAVPHLPEAWRRGITWALEPDRDQRPADVPTLWQALFGEAFPEDLAPPVAAGAPPLQPPTVAPRAAPAPNSAIPKPARSLVGRRTEVEAVLGRLEPRGGLVTLVGTAGVGKTRVAIEIAARWRAMRRPAWWIELAAARDEQDVARAVAMQLTGGPGRVGGAAPGDGSLEAIGRALARQGALLLVLDNLEQLSRAAVELIATWVRAAPSLRVLGTSRHPLGLPEENEVEVQPLPVPDDPAEVLRSDAWALFCAAAPPGAVDEIDAGRAQRLLRALDGLPLAFELAGARLEVLTVEQLEGRMGDRFALLAQPRTPSSDPRVPHHGGLYDAIAWSWSLLSPAERSALAQLSAFVAPFGLDAAEGVVAIDDLPVLDALHGLIRRSLVRRAGARFALLGAIREFAARQLEEGDRIGAWTRHAAWHAQRLDEVMRDGRVLFTTLAIDPNELVPDWGAVIDRAQELPELVEAALASAVGRAAAFESFGPLVGALRTAEAALALPDPGTPAAYERRTALRLRRAFGLRRTGRPAEAIAELEGLRQDAALPPKVRATVIAQLGDLATDQDREADAIALYREGLALARVHGPRHLEATMSSGLGSMLVRDTPAESAALLDRALELAPAEGVMTLLQVRKDRGWVALYREDAAAADREYQEVLALAERAGHRRSRLYALGQLGLIREWQGRLDQAIAMFREAEAGMEEDGDSVYAAYYRGYRARALARLRRWDEAAEMLDEVLAVPNLAPSMASQLRLVLGVIEARRRRPDQAEAASARDTGPNRAVPAELARAFAEVDRGESAFTRELIGRLATMDAETRRELLLDLVSSELEEESTAWHISADGAAVRGPDGARIDLGRHAANARILAFLARMRADAPGRTTDAEGLAAAGWPGERIVPSAAANRVRVALSALRRAGLAALIDRADGGWRLDPHQPVRYPAGVTASSAPRRA